MWIIHFLFWVLQLSNALMWQPKSQPAPYPEHSELPNSNSGSLRRRPTLSSFSSEDVELSVVPLWPDIDVALGQVAAVTVDQHNRVVIFHRGSHVWDGLTFDEHHNYMKKEYGPVNVDTVLVLDPTSGKVLQSWGKGLFYMPHGLTIDYEDNLWVTDVALHQIFKYPPLGSLSETVQEPLLKRGERFVNGKDEHHFCKPSAVAVMRNGDFFVADGYCNARIIKYDKGGVRLMTWGRSSFTGTYGHKPGPYQFNIPHALTLAEDRNLVCAADRENGRVQCFYSHNGTFVYEITSESIGTRLFSVAYTPTKGGLFYLVNGPGNTAVQGFVVDANNLNIVSTFQAGESELSNPHDVAVSPDGECVYVVQLDPHRVLKFVHKGDNKNPGQKTASISTNQSSNLHLPSTLTTLLNPTEKSLEEANSTSSLLVGLNLMANSSLVKSISPSMVALTSFMVILFLVTGSGIVWYLRSRRRAYPAIPNDGFHLSHLLASHSRRGFEQVSTEESDDDRAESDQPV